MHAYIPTSDQIRNTLIRLGRTKIKYIAKYVNQVPGNLVSKVMATLLKLAFQYAMRNCLFLPRRKSLKFFKENFVFLDPNNLKKEYYYQGKILIRTLRPNDNVNVLIQFCPKPESIYKTFGMLNIDSIIQCDDMTEKEADSIMDNPEKVDLVIFFKDTKSILELAEEDEIDMGALLFENLVQFKGNLGQLFKFGGVAKNLQTEIL